jgi:hypothetical protein
MARPDLTFPPSNPDHLSMVSSQPSTMSTICMHVVYSPHLNVPLLEWNTSPQRQHNLFHVCPIFFPYAPNQNATIPSFLYAVIQNTRDGLNSCFKFTDFPQTVSNSSPDIQQCFCWLKCFKPLFHLNHSLPYFH